MEKINQIRILNVNIIFINSVNYLCEMIRSTTGNFIKKLHMIFMFKCVYNCISRT